MFRLSLAVFASVCVISLAAPGPAPNMPEPSPKDMSYLSMDSEEEMPEIDHYHTTKQFSELRTVLGTIKAQFREIIEELLSQVLNYFKEILKQLKVKLLKKLGVYSVSDVLRRLFDGMTDFIVEPVPEYYEPVRNPTPTAPAYSYRPFSLASLLGAKSNAK